jgi:hypothetical protein
MVQGSTVHTAEWNLKKRIRTTNCFWQGPKNEITKEKRRCWCVGGGRSLPGCGRAAGGAIESAKVAEVVWRRENNKRMAAKKKTAAVMMITTMAKMSKAAPTWSGASERGASREICELQQP